MRVIVYFSFWSGIIFSTTENVFFGEKRMSIAQKVNLDDSGEMKNFFLNAFF